MGGVLLSRTGTLNHRDGVERDGGFTRNALNEFDQAGAIRLVRDRQ